MGEFEAIKQSILHIAFGCVNHLEHLRGMLVQVQVVAYLDAVVWLHTAIRSPPCVVVFGLLGIIWDNC